MFQLLNENNRDERMITVINAALPADVLAFLTPESGIRLICAIHPTVC